MSKKSKEQKEIEDFVDRLKREQAYYDSLSPKEKAKYDKEREAERQHIKDLLARTELTNVLCSKGENQ